MPPVLYVKIFCWTFFFFCLYSIWEQKVLFWLVCITPRGYVFILIGKPIFHVLSFDAFSIKIQSSCKFLLVFTPYLNLPDFAQKKKHVVMILIFPKSLSVRNQVSRMLCFADGQMGRRYGRSSRYRSSRPDVLCKKSVLRNFAKFTGKHSVRVSFLIKLQAPACNFIKKKALPQVLSCEFYKISKNTFFHITLLVATFVDTGFKTGC